MSTSHALIENLPKAELHVHIEGALEAEAKLRLATRNGIALEHQNAGAIRASYDFSDMHGFLRAYNEGLATFVEAVDFYEVTREYLDTARGQNVRYAEMHFDPQLHLARGVAFETMLEGMTRAIQEGEVAGIESALIMGVYRDVEGVSALDLVQQSEPYRGSIVALGLYPYDVVSKTDAAAFVEAAGAGRALGYRITAHCNVGQPDSTATIRDYLDTLDLDRIDHGVDILADSALIEAVIQRGICLTVCPIESLARPLRFVEELRQLIDAGLIITVNSDDPSYFLGRYLGDVLQVVHERAGITLDEVVALQRNAFQASWLGEDRKREYLAAIDAFVAAAG